MHLTEAMSHSLMIGRALMMKTLLTKIEIGIVARAYLAAISLSDSSAATSQYLSFGVNSALPESATKGAMFHVRMADGEFTRAGLAVVADPGTSV